jgi:hypothetical protein
MRASNYNLLHSCSWKPLKKLQRLGILRRARLPKVCEPFHRCYQLTHTSLLRIASAVLGSSCDHSAEAPLESSGAPVPAPRYSAELCAFHFEQVGCVVSMARFVCRFSGLWARFEPPDEANRWDSPLFRVDGDAEPSSFEDTFHAVALALFEGKRVKATSATTAVGILTVFSPSVVSMRSPRPGCLSGSSRGHKLLTRS